METITGLNLLRRVHYNFFMKQSDFWYRKDLQEADKIVCVLASDARQALEETKPLG